MATPVDATAGLDAMDHKSGTMTQELVLLGILAENPLPGYGIRKAIEDKLTPVVGRQPGAFTTP